MSKHFNLFIKIMLILIIFSMLLPQFVDHLMDLLMLDKGHHRPRGNSTFVSVIYIHQGNLKENFLKIIKCFAK